MSTLLEATLGGIEGTEIIKDSEGTEVCIVDPLPPQMFESALIPPETKTTIELYAFRNNRSSSLLKHTGICYHSSHQDKYFRHDVGQVQRKASLAFLEEIKTAEIDNFETFKSTCDKLIRAATFTVEIGKWEKFIKKEWKYNIALHNCRDHVKECLLILEKDFAVEITPEARHLMDMTQARDKAVVGAGIAALVTAGLGALLYLAASGSADSTTTTTLQQNQPQSSPRKSPRGVSPRKTDL